MEDLICASRIARVALFGRGAIVTRIADVPEVPAARIIVGGVTVHAEPGSLRVKASGRRVRMSRFHLQLPDAPITASGQREKLEAVRLDVAKARERLRDLSSFRDTLAATSPRVAVQRGRRFRVEQRAADAIAAVEFLHQRIAKLDEMILREEAEVRRRSREEQRLALALGQAGSSIDPEGLRPVYDAILELDPAGGAGSSVEISYVVRAARWWPAYSARLGDGSTAAFRIEAFVAQSTDEHWEDAELSFSTAPLARDVTLPELHSLRLGRKQPPKRNGFREPPEGLDALFAGFDRAKRSLPAPHAPEPIEEWNESVDLMAPSAAAAREDTVKAVRVPSPEPRAHGMAPSGAPPPPAARPRAAGQAPAPARPMSLSMPSPTLPPPPMGAPMPQMMRSRGMPPPQGAAEIAAQVIAPEGEAEETAGAWLDYDRLELDGPEGPRRGRLVARGASEGAFVARQLEAPRFGQDPGEGSAIRRFSQTRFDAVSRADVEANGRPHRILAFEREVGVTFRFVTVPRESAEVFREVVFKNPLDRPLLAGPVDVFSAGALLSTAPLEGVGAGGEIRFALGVEERLRVVRNARVDEQTAGFLGGKTQVVHTVTIELASALGFETTARIFDRLPVSDEKEMSIELREANPRPEAYDQAERAAPIRGGLAWNVRIPKGEKVQISYSYAATFPGKTEIQGGNRRE